LESQEHQDLVKLIIEWAEIKISPGKFSMLQVDNSSFNAPSIFNSIPDVFYEDPSQSLVILGEAKSINDFNTAHSLSQYKDYLNYMNNREGYIVFACRWKIIKAFKEVINSVIISNNIKLKNIPIFLNGDLGLID